DDPDDIETAFELIMIVERQIPKWSPTGERLQAILFQDAQQKLKKGEQELGLALLEECHLLTGDYQGLEQLQAVTVEVGRIVDDLVGKAVADKDFPKAQHFIRRVGQAFPNHPVRQKWLQRLEQMAQKRYDAARTAYEAKDYPGAAAEIQEAVKIWQPERENAATYRQVLMRYQQLHVGVTSLEQKFPVKTSTDRRHKRLVDARMFEPYRADNIVYYDTAIFEQWDPLDLGRRVVFRLRKQQPYYSGLPDITSPNIVDTFKARLDPGNKAYNERFASYIKEFLVSSPREFEVRFSRIPLRVEPLFAFPLTTPEGDVYTRRFDKRAVDSNTVAFSRRHKEPEAVTEYHVAEVIEKKFDRSGQAIQALQRGEIQMIAHLQPWEIDTFESRKEFYRRQYSLPFVHVIQFNPKTEILQNTQVRRALSKSIDRERILKQTVLRDDAMRHGRVVAAPWPSNSFANSSLVEAPVYTLAGLREAAALRGTAEMVLKKEKEEEKAAEATDEDAARTKELPELRLVLEEDPVVERAAPEIVKFWGAAGFKVKIIESTDDEDGWDLVYHKLKMNEPLSELWPFLTLSDVATVDGLLVLPDWLKQKLVDLDFTGNFPAAEKDLKLLHRHLSAQGFFIPLWEIDDYGVFSTSVSGFAKEPVSPYQGVTGWVVKPEIGG
ncbi:MAG: ABC transporter substrate-binding protein, partial [Planctomycetaceae bacterium]